MPCAIKLGHVGIVARNYQAMLDYYTGILGFELAEQTAQTSYLRVGVDHHAIALHKTGEKSGLQHIAFQIDPHHALTDVVKELSAAGITSRVESDADPSIPELVSFCDCEGVRIELYSVVKHPPSIQKRPRFAPRKLGHVAREVADVKGTCSYYTQRLGFRISDWMGDFFVFMRCGPDHHTVNFIAAPEANLHHVAYEVNDWADIQKSTDILGEYGIRLIWGPVRHGIGHNISAYHRDPDGNRVEIFCELDLMLDERLGYFEPRPWHEDNPQRPKVWNPTDYRTANIWGIDPGEKFGSL